MSKRKDNVKRTAPRPNTTANTDPKRPLTFGPETYKWLAIGFGLVMIGLFLMAGGRDADPSVFDTDAMYGFRRITLAPLVILGGLGVTMYAILKK